MDLFDRGGLNLSHPIVLWPACTFAVALAVAPFAVWRSQEAAAFYGAALSASAAVIAVVVTSSLSAKQERERDERERRQSVLAMTRVAAFELRLIALRLLAMHKS